MASLHRTLQTQHVRLIVQVLLLLAMVFVFCYSVLATDWVGMPIISLLLIVMVTANIIRIVEKSNRDFAQFINNISHNDFTTSSGFSNQIFGANTFIEAQKTLLAKYRKLKADSSAQTDYLQMVVDHVDAALLCFDENNRIEFTNRAAEKLLQRRYLPTLHSISLIDTGLAEAIQELDTGENRVLKLVLDGELNHLILSATEFVLLEKKFKLVSLKNIKGALDEREIESWQKLIKVLTHEIMNSMTPIVSLSRYVDGIVSDRETLEALQDPDSEQSRDLHLSLEAIQSRTQGLMDFVDKYRSISNLPKPKFAHLELKPLCERIELLFAERAKQEQVDFTVELHPQELVLTADESLLEQVIINLVSNAFDAVQDRETRKVTIQAALTDEGATTIRISDTGYGISKEVIDNIFTPFYTTKENGSGIGLTLSRQLARLNQGSLSVSSLENEGSQFTLSF